MDKKTLRQYMDLIKEIQELEKRINKREIVRDSVRASNPHFPYQSMVVQLEGVEEDKIIEKRLSILNKRKAKCEKMKLKIEKFIANISDSRTRRIFELRYFYGYSWEKISRTLGSCNESYARKIHDRFLRFLNK